MSKGTRSHSSPLLRAHGISLYWDPFGRDLHGNAIVWVDFDGFLNMYVSRQHAFCVLRGWLAAKQLAKQSQRQRQQRGAV